MTELELEIYEFLVDVGTQLAYDSNNRRIYEEGKHLSEKIHKEIVRQRAERRKGNPVVTLGPGEGW